MMRSLVSSCMALAFLVGPAFGQDAEALRKFREELEQERRTEEMRRERWRTLDRTFREMDDYMDRRYRQIEADEVERRLQRLERDRRERRYP